MIYQYIHKHIRTTAYLYQLLQSREDQLRSLERLAQPINQRVPERDSAVSRIGLTQALPHRQTNVIRLGIISLGSLMRAPHHQMVRLGDPIIGILSAGISDDTIPAIFKIRTTKFVHFPVLFHI